MNKPFVIAIDGPAASGKGSLAKKMAKELGFDFLDTGALYRRVALRIIENKIDIANTSDVIAVAANFVKELNTSYDDQALRNDIVGNIASIIAQIPDLRRILLDFQRDFAKNAKTGAVLDGRDIGTVICPQADLKLFITATCEKRAQRRHKELQLQGLKVKYEAVLAEMQERDDRDNVRLSAHLNYGHDAIVIDTSEMTPEEVFQKAIDLYHTRSR